MKLFVIFVIVLYLFMVASLCYASESRFSSSQDNVEVMNLLKRLNKHPVQSIKSPDGDIIDCIDISHQPAFDHPSLKNHTIQMRPNYHPHSINDENFKVSSKMNTSKHESSSSSDDHKGIDQLWHVNGECPKGTIPIRRTKKEDVLRASSVKSYGKKSSTTVAHPSDNNGVTQNHQYAIGYVSGEFYGTKATMNVWKPMVQKSNEFSLSQLWIIGGSYKNSDLNTIEAGWQVYQELYGDYNSRLFIYWTSDAYQKTGCYNLMCSGFIQTNNKIVIGGTVPAISQFQGSQSAITLLIWKDGKEGNWWMKYGNELLGYWPSTLFSHLKKSASTIEWGGEVVNIATNGQHTTTQMGSGQFAENGFKKASYFRKVQIVDESNTLRDAKDVGKIISQANCYNIQTGTGTDVDYWGSYFYYGGPGRNPNCP